MAAGRLIFLLLLFLIPDSVAAQDSINRAGLYIDFGDGRQIMVVVPFSEPEISAIELLERSELPLLQVPFGALGDAVCMIEDVGCDVSACRATLCQTGASTAFWQFQEQDESGAWLFSPLGASTADVTNGEVHAWVFTGVDPELPNLTIADLEEQTGFSGAVSVWRSYESSDDDADLQPIYAGAAVLVICAGMAGFLIVRKRTSHATG